MSKDGKGDLRPAFSESGLEIKPVYTADDVISETSNIVCVKVDGDDNRDLVKKYDITGYPTLVLVSPEGEILKKISGYQSVAKTVGFLK